MFSLYLFITRFITPSPWVGKVFPPGPRVGAYRGGVMHSETGLPIPGFHLIDKVVAL